VVAAALRRCRVCGCELPTAPVTRFVTCRQHGWEPAPGPQTEFLRERCFEAFYGGAASGGKSESLIALPLSWVHVPDYRAVIFRRQSVDLIPSIIDRAKRLYPKARPGTLVMSPRPMWTFDSGAVVYFGHLNTEDNVYDWDSTELHTICFDELSHFTERQYVYMLSRLRSPPAGVPLMVRSGSNPPEDATGAWLLNRFAPWVDRSPDYHGRRVASGKRLYFINSREKGEAYVPKGTIDEEGNPARARVFIQARVTDNPYVDKAYRSTLMMLDPVSRARKLDGDWSQFDKPGALWQRAVINAGRVTSHPGLHRIGIGLDPSGSHRKGSDEAGIVAAGIGPCFCSRLKDARGELVREEHAFVLSDLSGVLPAASQARKTIGEYHARRADFVVAEINYGGEWIKTTIQEIDSTVNVDVVHVSKGKAVRAEPVAALYGKLEPTSDGPKLDSCRVHHVGTFASLEAELCTFDPRTPPTVSPGRMDALVFVLSKLLLGAPDGVEGMHSSGERRWDARRDRGRMMT
jgi:hypothetical protein